MSASVADVALTQRTRAHKLTAPRFPPHGATMHIWLIGQHYPPEPAAAGNRCAALAQGFRRLGHQVTVFTGVPNYPDGVVWPGYRSWRFTVEDDEGVTVVRCPLHATRNAGTARRILNHLSFMCSATLAGLVRRGPDVVVATSPPLFAGLAGWALGRLKGVASVLDVRDLWPASIVAVGALGNRHALAGLERLERFLYASADGLVFASPAFREDLAQRGILPPRVEVVTNGYDPVPPPAAEAVAATRRRFGFEGRFAVLYLGTIGMAHDLGVVLDAAERCRDPDMVFSVVGDGAERARLVAEASRRGLANVHFPGMVPRTEVAATVAAADVCLIHLADRPLFRTVIPSKMFDAWGMERPILLGVEGTARELLERAGGGLAFAPGDADALVEAALALKGDPERAKRLGEAGRAYAETHYRRADLVERYADFLRGTADARRVGRVPLAAR